MLVLMDIGRNQRRVGAESAAHPAPHSYQSRIHRIPEEYEQTASFIRVDQKEASLH
jgi:hypothetical protein